MRKIWRCPGKLPVTLNERGGEGNVNARRTLFEAEPKCGWEARDLFIFLPRE